MDIIYFTYPLLINFVLENQNKFIVFNNFSNSLMKEIIDIINKMGNLNISLVKLNSKLAQVKYERHLLKKQNSLKETHNKIKNLDVSGKEYLKKSHSVFRKNRIRARIKIILDKKE